MTHTEELQKSPAITRYLAELDGALRGVSEEERRAMVADLTDHIAAEVDALPPDADVYAVEQILARLGSPAALAAEASGPSPSTHPSRFARFRRSRTFAALTVLILALGGVLVPVAGWIVGVVFLWMSDLWRVRDKVIGTLVWPGGLGLVLFLGLFVPGSRVTTSCSSATAGGTQDCVTLVDGPPLWFGPVLLAVLLIGQLVVAIHLYRTFSRRLAVEESTAAEDPLP